MHCTITYHIPISISKTSKERFAMLWICIQYTGQTRNFENMRLFRNLFCDGGKDAQWGSQDRTKWQLCLLLLQRSQVFFGLINLCNATCTQVEYLVAIVYNFGVQCTNTRVCSLSTFAQHAIKMTSQITLGNCAVNVTDNYPVIVISQVNVTGNRY